MLDKICQIIILFLTPLAILLISKKIKWGFVAGLLSQPFWIVTSYLNRQWGVFIVSIVYLFIWGFGIYEWFFKAGKNDLCHCEERVERLPSRSHAMAKHGSETSDEAIS